MITLITGLPGEGKTLWALTHIKALAERDQRPVFYARINALKLPWQVIDPFAWMDCPANAIIVIDECQKSADETDPKSPPLFGVRQRGSAVPRWASALETHRHGGVDLFLITQDPSLIDSHDRRLCGTHYHVVRFFGMERATIHRYKGVRDQVAKSRAGSVSTENWSFNREAFGWYESAEKHTHKRSIPFKLVLLCVLPVLVLSIAGYSWWRLTGGSKQGVAAAAGGPGSAVAAAGSASSSSAGPRRLTTAEYLREQVPRVAGLVHTAPIYDDVTKVVEAPFPAACIASAAKCVCASQQGTRLDVPDRICRQVVADGFFVPWDRASKSERREAAGNGPAKPAAAPQRPLS